MKENGSVFKELEMSRNITKCDEKSWYLDVYYLRLCEFGLTLNSMEPLLSIEFSNGFINSLLSIQFFLPQLTKWNPMTQI